MGRNLLLNMADHGFSVAGYDKDVSKVAALRQEAEHRNIRGAENVSGVCRPAPRAARRHDARSGRRAGRCGDSRSAAVSGARRSDHRRAATLTSMTRTCEPRRWRSAGFSFSASASRAAKNGARHGPSIMPGGPKDAYERVPPDPRSSGRQGGRRALCHLARAGVGGTLREDGPQRHRVRPDAA